MDNPVIHAVCRAAVDSGLVSFVRNAERRRGGLLSVLCYHRIGDPEAESGLLDPSLLAGSPEMFKQQMEFLAENYRPISIVELLHAIESRESLPPGAVMVTFDDGYRDFMDIAWPILDHYQIPTLLNLPTAFMSSPDQLFWWDRLFQGIFKTRCQSLSLPSIGNYPLESDDQRWTAFNQLKDGIRCMNPNVGMPMVDVILQELQVTPQTKGLLLNWADARFLSKQGCYLAAHTRHHCALSRISIEEARQEIRAGQEDMLWEIGTTLPVFAYPYGRPEELCDGLPQILREEGFEVAMTTVLGNNVFPGVDPMQLKRIVYSRYHTFAEFQLSLTGMYDLYYTCQKLFLHKS